jgi:hypothetical protein
MHVQLDPHAPIYILVNDDGETEVFQFPHRFTYTDSNGQEGTATIDDVEEFILFLDERSAGHLRRTLVKIDARLGTVDKILPRF